MEQHPRADMTRKWACLTEVLCACQAVNDEEYVKKSCRAWEQHQRNYTHIDELVTDFLCAHAEQ